MVSWLKFLYYFYLPILFLHRAEQILYKAEKMGRLGFEPRTSRLKAECSTTELATRLFSFSYAGTFGAPHGYLI